MSLAQKENMTDVAFHCMSKRKKEIEFARLWQEVVKALKIPEEKQSRKKAQFYSELMLDSRFAALKGNKWDLRNRRKYEELHSNKELLDEIDDEYEESEEEENLDVVKQDDEF